MPGSGLALLQLNQNHPNPFNPSTTISYSEPWALVKPMVMLK